MGDYVKSNVFHLRRKLNEKEICMNNMKLDRWSSRKRQTDRQTDRETEIQKEKPFFIPTEFELPLLPN